MLSENIARCRRQKGLTQEQLAQELHVVRQTVSKWEKGLSVPDASLLCRLSEVLDVPVAVLLGEMPADPAEDGQPDRIDAIAAQLAEINTRLARQSERRRRYIRIICIALIIVVGMILLFIAGMMIFTAVYASQASASLGIIGGADGPTSIIVAGTGSQMTNIIAIAALLIVFGVAVYQLYRTGKT